ncbi:winged helix-turn-helix domain-containing protein [Bartonella sp. DGB1]|uniref:winged helix-turn-helix domain-containing protein n=1 Tax=Bartonella sp. DGB1 TaxID=3239807 RepID=UPI0035244894
MSNPESNIIFVFEDKTLVSTLATLLSNEGYIVNICDKSDTTIDYIIKNTPHLVILDAQQPPLDNLELVRQLRQKTMVPIICLSDKNDEFDEILALKLGADDYFYKPMSARLFVEKVKALLRRMDKLNLKNNKSYNQDEQIMERGSLILNKERHICSWKGVNIRLTVTEFLILQSLAQRPGVVKSRDTLMDEAYGDQVYVDDRTIDGHLKRLRKKFKSIDPDFNAIETLYGVGYLFKEQKN